MVVVQGKEMQARRAVVQKLTALLDRVISPCGLLRGAAVFMRQQRVAQRGGMLAPHNEVMR